MNLRQMFQEDDGMEYHPQERPSIEAKLLGEKQVLEERLERVNDALLALRENPQILDVFNRVSRALGY